MIVSAWHGDGYFGFKVLQRPRWVDPSEFEASLVDMESLRSGRSVIY